MFNRKNRVLGLEHEKYTIGQPIIKNQAWAMTVMNTYSISLTIVYNKSHFTSRIGYN
jgi:hypothetical protein